MTITAATRVAGVIGDPVRHSLSPVLHNVAYQELGLDWVYVAFEVPDGGARGALDAMRLLDLVGLSVTMPHKTAAAGACDELSTTAAALHSVNTVSVGEHSRLVGDSTDGEGFLRALRDEGHDPAGRAVALLGAGGAARAVARALGEVHAQVLVCARKPKAAEQAALLAGGTPVPWADRAEAVAAAELIVNATPIGMVSYSDAVDLPFPLEVLHPGQILVDLVYHPIETPLLRGARGQGAGVVDGLGMLVHQAALQVEQWTGRDAPVTIMRAAAELALGRTT